jgi:hypothetical protein
MNDQTEKLSGQFRFKIEKVEFPENRFSFRRSGTLTLTKEFIHSVETENVSFEEISPAGCIVPVV